MASRPLRSDPAALVALLAGPGRPDLARFLIRQRWFAAKTRGIAAVEVLDWAVLDPDGPFVLLLLAVDGDPLLRPGHRVGRGRAGGDARARGRGGGGGRPPRPALRTVASSPPSRPASPPTVATAASPSGPPRAGHSRPIRTRWPPGASPASRAIPRSWWATSCSSRCADPSPASTPISRSRASSRRAPPSATCRGWRAGSSTPARASPRRSRCSRRSCRIPETDGLTWSRRSRPAALTSSDGPIPSCKRSIAWARSPEACTPRWPPTIVTRTSARSPSATTTSRGGPATSRASWRPPTSGRGSAPTARRRRTLCRGRSRRWMGSRARR